MQEFADTADIAIDRTRKRFSLAFTNASASTCSLGHNSIRGAFYGLFSPLMKRWITRFIRRGQWLEQWANLGASAPKKSRTEPIRQRQLFSGVWKASSLATLELKAKQLTFLGRGFLDEREKSVSLPLQCFPLFTFRKLQNVARWDNLSTGICCIFRGYFCLLGILSRTFFVGIKRKGGDVSFLAES